jgi:hypothetical protein
VISFTTTRRDGNVRPPARLRKLLAAKRLPLAIATGEQVHGARIAVVPKLGKPRKYPGVDGLLTAKAGQPLGIFTADCAAIFLSVPSRGVVGLLHAGWRGVRAGLLLKALRRMRRRWACSSRDVRLWLGPCIGPCCFEVQWDVARYFPATRRRKKDRWTVDLRGEIRRQARRLGLKAVSAAPGCTRHTSRYFSFRRDPTQDRQISVIMR